MAAAFLAGRVGIGRLRRFSFPLACAGTPQAHRHPLSMTAAAVTTMSSGGKGSSIEPADQSRWEEVLDHLSSMISGKRRADGTTWKDAHENMPIYLQVKVVGLAAAGSLQSKQAGCS